MSAPAPLVSILIPCYNAQRWLGEAVESALAQTHTPCEVIVVDDGSTDGSRAVLEGFGSRIRFETTPNQGGNRARNRLLDLAQGVWLQYLDADDYLKPDKVAGQLAALSAAPETDVLFGPSIFAYHEADSADGAEATASAPREVLKPIPEPHDPWVLLARWFLPQTGAPLWRRQALLDVGGWKPDQPCCQEHELYLRLLKAGKRFRYDDASGSVYRQWGSDTVSKRKIALVHARRLEIEDAAEAHLKAEGQLSPERLDAISLARFEVARALWQYDRPAARRLHARLLESDPEFRPSGRAAPAAYRKVYRALGFAAAERMADWKRRLTGS